ncbi:MAG: 30S ribosomal protein S20 [Candidatus Pacebacteria bacterium]|nr:30S ribosomal protein S20 [Candidatus Paceibacterota bacterium]
MAVTKSAQKALRQNIRRKKRNIKRKTEMKSTVKEVRSLIAEKKFAEAKALLPRLYKTLDKTAKVGTIKKNTASRKKSRLTKSLNKALAAK